MNGSEHRSRRIVLTGSFAGWAGDAFDYQIYSLALPLLIAHWTLTPQWAGSIASVTLAAAALGGMLGGWLSDRFGRWRMLQIAILLAAVATTLCAVVQSPGGMLAARALQGVGFGAEWSVGAVLLAEHAPDDRRGRYLGWMQSAWAVGWAGAVVVYLLATTFLPADIAWRAMFAAGLLPALLVIWLRRHPRQEPERVAVAPGDATVPYTRLALAGAVGFGAHGGYHSLFTWLPTLLRQSGVSDGRTGVVLLVMTLGFAIGCILAGRMSDHLGRRVTIGLFAGLSTAVAMVIGFRDDMTTHGLLLALPTGIAAGGTPAVLGAWFSEMFPASVRGAAVGFAYNAGRVASALIPGAIGWAAGSAPLACLVGVAAAASYGLIILILPLLPETRQPLRRRAA